MKAFIALAVLLFAISTVANDCGGNCPSNGCANCPCGNSPNWQDAGSWCSRYGGWDQGCCQCIVSHESNGNANAAHDNGGGNMDVGLFQINQGNWGDCSGGNAPCDVEANLNCAIQIWQWGGNSFSLWATAQGCGCA